MFDLTQPKWQTYWRLTYTPEDARSFMDTAQYRLGSPESAWWANPTPPIEGLSNVMEIYHDKIWKVVCRTDLKDDVTTGSYDQKTLDAWRDYFKQKITYGVRASSTHFAIVDSFSDG